MMMITGHWIAVKDGDPRAVAIFKRHYSCVNHKANHVRYGFSGKGESMVLITLRTDCLWCWRKVENEGINCSVFRNEGDIQSSELIMEADELAWQRWTNENRHYTYVNARKIKSRHPGYCFLKAGWDYQRDNEGKPELTKGGLYILEVYQCQ